ncbi:MAG: DUF58 domain-containing protein [Microcoleaceae cyanobacterium]
MLPHQKLTNWLETRWVAPAYAGGLLSFLALFFFGAATNTMAGWLYVISGTSFALLGLAAILPPRSLSALQIHRYPIEPVSAGYQLTVELEIENPTLQPKTLLQVRDQLSPEFKASITTESTLSNEMTTTVIETLAAQSTHRWVYYLPTQNRGIYNWQNVELRTAAPLGLFWCRRSWSAPVNVIVYPVVLPLSYCPLIDNIGEDISPQVQDRRHQQMATEGLTRALRPYRYGDPTRLIHWRTSARYGELRIRELEISTAGQEVVIALDSGGAWQPEIFEQAVTAAASLYFYAARAQLNVQLWTAATGLVRGNRVVLSSLAGVMAGEEIAHDLPQQPLIWLTQNQGNLTHLPSGSRWVRWPDLLKPHNTTSGLGVKGLEINLEQPLELQLQSQLV